MLRLNEVLTRVVAWHNRHPLARRIQATQVHSIGEVLLPFASALPLVGTTAPAPAPAPVRAPAPTSAPAAAAAPKAGGSLADVVSARAAARPAAAAAAAATATAPGWAPHSVSPDVLADPAGATDLDPFAPESAAGTAPASAGEGGRDDETAPADSITGPITGQSPDQKADPALDAAAPAAAAAPPLSDSDSDSDLGSNSNSNSDPDPDPDPDPDSESESDSSPAAAAAVAVDTATPARAVASVNEAPDIDLASGLDEPPQFNAASANKAANAPDPAVQPPASDIDVTSPPAAAPAAGLSGPAWPAAAPVGWLCRIARRIGMHRTGRRPGWPRLEAAFSRDFIWPLTPQQVARWAQRHGRAQSMAPADWPRRQVAPDPALAGPLRQAGLPHTVQLHLLTAAIGVGDRRIRVLMDGDGRILGPRAYSRPRSASAAVLLLAGLLGAGWQWAVPTSADGGGKAARLAQVAEAASAASAGSAVAAVAAASAASAAATTAAASVVALAASTASAPATVLPTSTTTASATAFLTASNTASVAAPITASATAPVTVATTASITAATPSAEPAADAPPLGRIRPALSDDERRIAKQQAVRLREAPGAAPATARAALAGAPPATVYAIVSRATGQRDAAARSLAVMRSARARLSSTTSDRSELMQNQGQWRAAWWPFASPLDAERARSMLAARGLKAEVVAF